MSDEADFEINITEKGLEEEEGPLTQHEIQLRRTFGYKHVLIQPSVVLGTGCYGSVIKAKLDHLPCAAKLLHHLFFTSNDPHIDKFIRRFKQECRILRQLKHPCIVQFLGVLEDPRPRSRHRPILLIELMEESLTHFLESRQSDLPYHFQVNITFDITSALDYLHANGIQHRDLSSNNILLTASGSRAKITDFGMSKIVDINPRMSRNKQTECPGTLAYMPPETLLKGTGYSNTIDVFSTGVLIIQIITRQFPDPKDPHLKVRDSKYKGGIIIPVAELERRENDLRKVYMTHPLRPIALDCLKDEGKERPTAANLCQRLAELKSTPEYTDSQSQYKKQVVTLPPTSSALAMRDTEIAVLGGEIKALNQEKRRSWGGIFHRGSMSKVDEKIAELQSRKQPLLIERENEKEEDRKKEEYKNENCRLKETILKLKRKNEATLSEIARLKRYVEELEREREKEATEQAKLQDKIAELKLIVQTYLHSKSTKEVSERQENNAENLKPVKMKKSVSLPSLKLGTLQEAGALSTAEQRKICSKVLRLNLSNIYQFLNVQLILNEMVAKTLIQPQRKVEVEAYSSKYAQNISAGVALFEKESTLHVLDLCGILQATDSSEQRQLAVMLATDYEEIFSKEKKEAIKRLFPSHSSPAPAELQMQISDLHNQFLHTLHTVIHAFEQLPNSLMCLKQFFSQLVLPMRGGKVVPLVNLSTYYKATTTKEVFRSQSSLWNCFSPHLLQMMAEECQCPPAIAAIKQFMLFRSRFSSSLVCRQTKLLEQFSSRAALLHPSHLACHTGPLSKLQSLHPSAFECLEEHRGSQPLETLRVSVQVNHPQLTLQDYDNITTAVCGYFEIPQAALVYAGCSENGHVVCWTTSAGLLPYLKTVVPGTSSDRLIAEQKILGIAAGDLHYHCLTLKEVELFEAAFYGLTKKAQTLILQNVSLNCAKKHGRTPLMVASFEGHADIVQTLIEAKAQISTQDENGWNPLHLAAQEGQVDVARLLLTEAQTLVNVQTEDGRTPLFIASCKGHVAVVKLLLQHRADVSIYNNSGWTPLTVASFNGKVSSVQTLIEAKAETDTQDKNGWTALMQASFEGHANVVQTLIEAKAQINTQEEGGWTALHLATHEGKVDVVRLLLTESQTLVNVQTEDGGTPLMAASFEGHADIAQTLIEAEAQINAQDEDGWTALHLATQEGEVDVVKMPVNEAQTLVNIQTEMGQTSLHVASWKGYRALVKLLLENHADVSICNKNGWTPLMIASFEGHTDILQMLIKAKAQISTQTENGSTALHLAAQQGKADVVRLLLIEAQILINTQTEDGETPLFIASWKGHGAVVKLLLQHNADVSICKANGWTPLMTAAFEGHADIVQTLIEAQAKINRQNEGGWTAFHLAAQEGKVDVVRLLLTESQTLVNIQTMDGQTPLYIASGNGHGAVVKLLLEHHADVSICRNNGWTPLMRASFEGHADIVQTLIEAQAQINRHNENGWTAIHLATQEGRINVVRLLLTEDQTLVNVQTEDGQTPLFIASWKGHGAVVKLLLQHNADISICKANGWTPLMTASFNGHADIVQTLIEAKAEIGTREEGGWTALHLAAHEGNIYVMRLLVNKAQTLVNIQTEDGQTPLFIASRKGHGAVVKLLLQHNADVSICKKNGWTPLMTASFEGHVNIVQRLTEAKAQINRQKRNGWTALHLATQEGSVDVVRLLLNEAQTLVNTLTEDGQTPLYIASWKGHVAVVKLLLQYRADIRISKKSGRTPLMIASFEGHAGVVQVLIEARAQINTQDKDGFTALHLAAQEGKIDVVRLLLTESEILVNSQTKDGKTPLFVASWKGYGAVVKLLLQHRADAQICRNNGWTALMQASFEGHANVVQTLIEAKAQINTQEEGGWTALHLAANKGRTDVVRLLLNEAETLFDIQTKTGSRPIDSARSHGYLDIVELLEQYTTIST